jgi:hypothetical protein
MEGALIFASIIVGIAVADQLVSLHRLLRRRRVVRWDWAAPAVALLVLLAQVQIWWSLARGEGALTIGAFLPMLVLLILMFLLASAVLPDEVPAAGLDLKSYYHDNGSYIWSLFSCAAGWGTATRIVTDLQAGATAPPLLAGRIPEFLVLAMIISLIFIRRRWWHAVALLILAGVGPVLWLSRSLG